MFWEHLFPDCLLQSAGSHDSDHCPLVFGCWIIKQGSQDSALNPFGLRKMISRGFLRRHGIPLLQLDAPSIIWQEKSGPWPKDCRAGSKRKLVMLTISWGWQGKSFITPRNSPGYLWFITQWDMVAVLHSQLKKHSLALSSLQRTIACCHSRIGWLGDGDANTSLFHSPCSSPQA